MTEPLRIGILGAARISDLSIIEPAHQLGHRLVAVAARNRQRAELYAAENDIERVHDSYGEVINDPEVEVVYNPLSNSLHAPWNAAAIRAGKHVLSEKPFASNADEASYVHALAASTSQVVFEAFQWRGDRLGHRLGPTSDRWHGLIPRRSSTQPLLPRQSVHWVIIFPGSYRG
jgi:predicted dehydrogenase